MERVQHRAISVNGLNMHVAEIGSGSTILFLHGFPECWYTWRHQMLFFADRGYRALAPDLRGYADTSGAPVSDPTKFTMLNLVGDMVSLIDAAAPQEDKVFVVGHDWGAMVAWAFCLYRPDKVKALINMSVPFSPRNPRHRPIETLKRVYGESYYIIRFQKPGVIEEEFAKIGTKNVLKNFLLYKNPGPLCLPKNKPFPATETSLPPWLSEEDLNYFAGKFEATGFTGALNYYRAIDSNWEVTAPWTGAKVKVPTKFIVGDLDLTYNAPGAKHYINNGGMKRDVPLLQEVVVLEGLGHFLHEENPELVNQHIFSFINKY